MTRRWESGRRAGLASASWTRGGESRSHRTWRGGALLALAGVLPLVLAGCGPAASVGAPPGAARGSLERGLRIDERDGLLLVSNGRVSIAFDRVFRSLRGLALDGQELLDRAAVDAGYFDLNTEEVPGGYFRLGRHGTAGTRHEVRRGPDFVDLVVSRPADATLSFEIRHHWVLRAGETGLHVYTELARGPWPKPATLIQARFVLRGDPGWLDHHSVEDDLFGPMPRPADLLRAREVQDVTYDLAGIGAYPWRYYSKYDWHACQRDHRVHGLLGRRQGEWYGLWVVAARRDFLGGGPDQCELTVHAPAILLGAYASQHYSGGAPRITSPWRKTYGPFYVHLNRGGSPAALRAEAVAFADPTRHDAFYDRLAIADWVPSAGRGDVEGRLRLADGTVPRRGLAILAAEGMDFRAAAGGYNEWAELDAGGAFRVAGVRPGVYRLTAYAEGVFGEQIHEGVVVAPGGVTRIGDLTWQPETHGRTLWQIGIPDRSAAEFRHGDDYRTYFVAHDFPAEFPRGVLFVVGESDPRRDWNYVQWQSWNGQALPDWRVRFDIRAVPTGPAALTVSVAGARRASLFVSVNGQPLPDAWRDLYSDGIPERSGIRGHWQQRVFWVSPSLLRAGTNEIGLRVANAARTASLMYDALRLEAP